MTGGGAHDCPVAERLIRRVKPSKRMLGDKAYDSAELREELDERGTKPVIPNRCSRKQPFSFSKRLYKLRWRIESAFNRLKDFRRIATRYDRLARNYLVCLPRRRAGMVDLMSLDLALLWQIFFRPRAEEPYSTVRASLQWSHDDVDDGVTHGGQGWLRWRSFFPASLG